MPQATFLGNFRAIACGCSPGAYFRDRSPSTRRACVRQQLAGHEDLATTKYAEASVNAGLRGVAVSPAARQ
jgi:hypothetical protein